ncbi:Vinx1 [Hyposoter didymator ichnovirus]|nr:Vinx1 [Hyposoter didymator ichnovirus]
MIHLMASLRGLLKPQSVHIDNILFCLHYKLTVIFLLAFSVLVGSRQYFGDPLNCEFSEYPNGDLNNYCFVQATFVRERSGSSRGRMRFYSYYSWVSLALFVQAMFFYVPRYMWKTFEGGRIKVLSMEVHSPTLKEDCIEKESKELYEYFRLHLQTHNQYAYKYFFCELLNLINTGGQIIFLNRFIGEGFRSYGLDIMFMNYQDMEHHMGQLFPISTICTFQKYGVTGFKETMEGICLLTHNPLNEKIYRFLWFWMYIVAIISLMVILYRIMTIFSSSFRFYLFRLTCTMNSAVEIRQVFNKLQIGDWFFMLLLYKNVNQRVYKELITQLAKHGDSGVSDP